MQFRQLSENYSVSAQILPEEIAAIGQAGFRSIIANRPDREDPGQPDAASIRAAAEAAGLAFRHIPVISGQVTLENAADQAVALDELPGPVFAYCRSGARCTSLFAMVQQMKGKG